jgi:hypothetical protein
MNKEKQFLAMFGRMARELRQEKPQTGAQIEEARKIPDNYTYAYEDQKMTIYHFRNAKQQYFCMVFIENELKPRFYGQFQNLQTAIERGKNGQERKNRTNTARVQPPKIRTYPLMEQDTRIVSCQSGQVR